MHNNFSLEDHYRPITIANLKYEIITKIIAERYIDHFSSLAYSIISTQKGVSFHPC
jgi:hypothetical protein